MQSDPSSSAASSPAASPLPLAAGPPLATTAGCDPAISSSATTTNATSTASTASSAFSSRMGTISVSNSSSHPPSVAGTGSSASRRFSAQSRDRESASVHSVDSTATTFSISSSGTNRYSNGLGGSGAAPGMSGGHYSYASNPQSTHQGDGGSDIAAVALAFFSSTNPSCIACGKEVFAMEMFTFDGNAFHRKCFKCTQCAKSLSIANAISFNGAIYCTKHNPGTGSSKKSLFSKRPVSMVVSTSSTALAGGPGASHQHAAHHYHGTHTNTHPSPGGANANPGMPPLSPWAARHDDVMRKLELLNCGGDATGGGSDQVPPLPSRQYQHGHHNYYSPRSHGTSASTSASNTPGLGSLNDISTSQQMSPVTPTQSTPFPDFVTQSASATASSANTTSSRHGSSDSAAAASALHPSPSSQPQPPSVVDPVQPPPRSTSTLVATQSQMPPASDPATSSISSSREHLLTAVPPRIESFGPRRRTGSSEAVRAMQLQQHQGHSQSSLDNTPRPSNAAAFVAASSSSTIAGNTARAHPYARQQQDQSLTASAASLSMSTRDQSVPLVPPSPADSTYAVLDGTAVTPPFASGNLSPTTALAEGVGKLGSPRSSPTMAHVPMERPGSGASRVRRASASVGLLNSLFRFASGSAELHASQQQQQQQQSTSPIAPTAPDSISIRSPRISTIPGLDRPPSPAPSQSAASEAGSSTMGSEDGAHYSSDRRRSSTASNSAAAAVRRGSGGIAPVANTSPPVDGSGRQVRIFKRPSGDFTMLPPRSSSSTMVGGGGEGAGPRMPMIMHSGSGHARATTAPNVGATGVGGFPSPDLLVQPLSAMVTPSMSPVFEEGRLSTPAPPLGTSPGAGSISSNSASTSYRSGKPRGTSDTAHHHGHHTGHPPKSKSHDTALHALSIKTSASDSAAASGRRHDDFLYDFTETDAFSLVNTRTQSRPGSSSDVLLSAAGAGAKSSPSTSPTTLLLATARDDMVLPMGSPSHSPSSASSMRPHTSSTIKKRAMSMSDMHDFASAEAASASSPSSVMGASTYPGNMPPLVEGAQGYILETQPNLALLASMAVDRATPSNQSLAGLGLVGGRAPAGVPVAGAGPGGATATCPSGSGNAQTTGSSGFPNLIAGLTGGIRHRGENPYVVDTAEIRRLLSPLAQSEYHGYIMEHIEVEALYFRRFFHGFDHTTYVGIIETPVAVSALGSVNGEPAAPIEGPVVISVRRDSESKHFRVLVRAKGRDWRLEAHESELKTRGRGKLSRRHAIAHVLPGFSTQKLIKVRNTRVERDLLKLDEIRLAPKLKIGCLYMKRGQNTEEQVFGNRDHSAEFEEFLGVLGERVELRGFEGFDGGLDTRHGNMGTHSVFTQLRGFEIMFHVSTLLPHSDRDTQQIQRKSQIGNDIVCIVFLDEPDEVPSLPTGMAEGSSAAASGFDPCMIRSQYLTVFIVVSGYELNGIRGYRVAVAYQGDVPAFGPSLPPAGFFTSSSQLRDFLLAKIINAENAAFKSSKFKRLHNRTRAMMLEDMVQFYTKTNGHGHQEIKDASSGSNAASSSSSHSKPAANDFAGSSQSASVPSLLTSGLNHSRTPKEVAASDEHFHSTGTLLTSADAAGGSNMNKGKARSDFELFSSRRNTSNPNVSGSISNKRPGSKPLAPHHESPPSNDHSAPTLAVGTPPHESTLTKLLGQAVAASLPASPSRKGSAAQQGGQHPSSSSSQAQASQQQQGQAEGKQQGASSSPSVGRSKGRGLFAFRKRQSGGVESSEAAEAVSGEGQGHAKSLDSLR